MHYVYKQHKETNQEYTKIGIYLDNLEMYRFKMAKRGYKDVCPMNI